MGARAYHEANLTQLCERLVRVLGAPTVDRLLQRSVVEIKGAYPSVEHLTVEDGRISFAGMDEHLGQLSDDEVRDVFMALMGVLLLLVARLLGREVATRLTEDVTIAELLESRLVGA